MGLEWTAPAGGADHYDIERSSNFVAPNNGFAFVTSVVGTSHPEANLASNTAYVYRVRAFDSANCPSPYSDIDLATTTVFTEAVAAVNAVRGAAGLSPFNWTDAPAPETPAIGGNIRKDQIQKLRDKLDMARSGLGLAPQQYTGQRLTIGTHRTVRGPVRGSGVQNCN